ncbi:MAG TPA: CDP-alcohol phosphatidyltransferase family protein [Bryobacteraceae bacterium]|nr:CDP-alcohol phosphatidyltransferase family protein [Bryobacteraceae bacterium]
MTPTKFQNAARSHTSLLAAAEKRALIGIAKRLPLRINSDHLTTLGFVALLAAGASYAMAKQYPAALLLVIPLLAVNWFGDSLDGTLARVRDCQRPRYGFYVDHILDATGMSVLMGGMALSGYISPIVAGLFLIAYLLLSIEIYLATYALGVFHLSYWNFGPTELRILLVIGNLFAFRRPSVTMAGHSFLLFDVGFAIGACALCLILLQAAFRHARELYMQEPMHKANR